MKKTINKQIEDILMKFFDEVINDNKKAHDNYINRIMNLLTQAREEERGWYKKGYEDGEKDGRQSVLDEWKEEKNKLLKGFSYRKNENKRKAL